MRFPLECVKEKARRVPGAWQRVLAAGRVSVDQRFIDLPADFILFRPEDDLQARLKAQAEGRVYVRPGGCSGCGD